MSEGLLDWLRIKINHAIGLDVIRFAGQHTLRAHVARVLALYEIDAVIDVGANEGHFGQDLRKLGFQGEIYSFEPVDRVFSVLASVSAKDSRWHAHNFALGASAGDAVINVSEFSQYSSLLRANEFGLEWEAMRVEELQNVVVRTLSGCFEEGLLPRKKRYLLKMDTQGYDIEVFKGAGSAISEVTCIISELSLIPIYHGMPHYLDALATYEQAGFLASGMYPITRNNNLTLNEMDCMLINVREIRISES